MDRPDQGRDRPRWLLGAILLTAAVMRFYALGREALWCDEAYTALTVRLPLEKMIARLVHTDDAPPFFYLLEKLSATLAGDSEAALRAGAALAGILTVAILLWRAHRRRAGADGWSAAFLAVATYGVFHARQARSYMLLMLLALVLVLSVKDMLLGRRRAGLPMALSGILLCMTHHVAIVLVLTSILLWPLGTRERPRLRTWLLWHAPPFAIGAIYWIMASSQFTAHMELNAWTARYWETHHIGLAPFYSLGVFTPGGLPASEIGTGFAVARSLSPQWSVASAALGLLCLVAAVRRTRCTNAGQPPSARREIALEAAFLFLPLLALLVASLIVTPVYMLTRTDAVAYPAFAMLIGRGLANLPRRLAGGILVFWTILALLALAPTYGFGNPRLAKGNDRRVAEEIVKVGLARDDWIVHSFMTAPAIEYYLDRLQAPHRVAWFPRVAGMTPAAEWPTPLDSLQAYMDEAAELRQAMEAALPEDGCAWIFALIEPSAAQAALRGSADRVLTIDQIGYPVSALVYALLGEQPIRPAFYYTQDWVGGDRVVLRIPRRSWVWRRQPSF